MWELALASGGRRRRAHRPRPGAGAAGGCARRSTRPTAEARPTPTAPSWSSSCRSCERRSSSTWRRWPSRRGARAGDAVRPRAQQLDSRDLERMAEEAREAAQRGPHGGGAASAWPSSSRCCDQLQQRPPGARRAADAAERRAKRQRGRQQMGAVQDMVGAQGGLLDHAQQRAAAATDQRSEPHAPRHGRPRRQPQRPSQSAASRRAARGRPPGAAGAAPGARRADAAIRRPDRPGAAEPGRGRPGDARRRPGARRRAQDDAAGAAEQRAIEALQKGGREMGQQIAQQFGRGQPGEGEERRGRRPADGSTGLRHCRTRQGRPGRPGPGRTLPGQAAAPPAAIRSAASSAQGTSGADEAATSACRRRWSGSAPARSRKNCAAAAPSAPGRSRSSTTSTGC